MKHVFENFNEVKHNPLKVYNRVVMSNNILADYGAEVLKEWGGQFSREELLQMHALNAYMKKYGQGATLKLVTRQFTPEEGENVVA